MLRDGQTGDWYELPPVRGGFPCIATLTLLSGYLEFLLTSLMIGLVPFSATRELYGKPS